MVEVTLVELRKQGKDKGHLTQILNSTFANPGGKKKIKREYSAKGIIIKYSESMKLPLHVPYLLTIEFCKN